jgi:predicted DNA-binding protein YlxM (UPF0122 family)
MAEKGNFNVVEHSLAKIRALAAMLTAYQEKLELPGEVGETADMIQELVDRAQEALQHHPAFLEGDSPDQVVTLAQ